MVKHLYKFWILTLLFFSFVNGAEVEITASVLQDGLYENQPIKGVISISHPKSLQVDKETFLIENEKLKVDFVKDVKVEPNDTLTLSIYNFTLPGKTKGAYALPSISVKVGGKIYRSIMSGYNVTQGKPKSSDTPSTSNDKINDSVNSSKGQTPNSSAKFRQETIKSNLAEGEQLKLDAGVDGSSSLYPGQNTKVFYRYNFKGNVGLTKEEIPLLDAVGFIKIGEKDINDFTDGSINVREISQVVQAIKPGTYDFGPSIIEGFAYENDSMGNPVYTSEKLSSKASNVQIVVLPFPEKQKPASFSGAVGQFTFKTALNSSDQLQVGDTLTLSLLIEGKGNLNNFSIPDLCCQPGFSGFFKQSDLPPKESVANGVKTVITEFKVLTSQAKEIPSIEFSYFDPETTKYVSLKSAPIPISVKQVVPQKQKDVKDQIKPKEILPTSNPEPIEVESIMYLNPLDLYNRPLGSYLAFALLPIGIALIAFQYHLKNYIEWKKTLVIPLTSKDLIFKAFKNEKACNFEDLQKALYLELKEKDIPKTHDLYATVEAFLADLDEKRFGKNGVFDIPLLKKDAETLYKKIQHYKKGE